MKAEGVKVKEKTEKKKKEKIQFAKKICFISVIIVAITLALDFILAYQEKEQISDVAIAVISTYGTFTTVGYFTLCGVRDTSLNKNGKTNLEEMKQYVKIIKTLKGETDYTDYGETDYTDYTDYTDNTDTVDNIDNTETSNTNQEESQG